MARYTKQDREEAIARLKQWLPPGKTIFTIIRRVSRSGMSRDIQLVYFNVDDKGEASDRHPTYSVAKALNVACHTLNGHDCIRVPGCGMDMAWHLVNEQLSYTLYGKPGMFTVRNL